MKWEYGQLSLANSVNCNRCRKLDRLGIIVFPGSKADTGTRSASPVFLC